MKYLTIALVVCIAALVFSIRSCQNIKEDRNRLSDNQQTLFKKAEYYRTNNNLSVASIGRLELTNKELKNHCSELVNTCDQLSIKIKRLQSASTSATETKYEIKTILKDSLIVRDSLNIDTLRCISYKDRWLTFSGCTSDNINFDVNIESRDTLMTIVHRVPRKFLFFRFGCKAIRQEVISKNPHSKITYTEYIELKNERFQK